MNALIIGQKERIIEASECFLIKLEGIEEQIQVSELIDACFYKRKSSSEQFLFNFKIPVFFNNNYTFKISGYVLPREGGFLPYFLDKIGMIKIDRKIEFRIKGVVPSVDYFK